VVEEDVALGDGGEDVGVLLGALGYPGPEGGVLQIGAVDEVVDLAQAVEVDRAVDAVEVDIGEVELFEEELLELLAAAVGDLETALTEWMAKRGVLHSIL